jgi:hypothetical protein
VGRVRSIYLMDTSASAMTSLLHLFPPNLIGSSLLGGHLFRTVGIFSRQARQDPLVDFIFTECCLVTFEPRLRNQSPRP